MRCVAEPGSFASIQAAPGRHAGDTGPVATKDSSDDSDRQRFRTLAQAALNADRTVGQMDSVIEGMGSALADFDRAMTGFDTTLESFTGALDDFSATLARVDAMVTNMVGVVERMEKIAGRVEAIVDIAEKLMAPVASAESMVRGLLGLGRRA